MTILQPGQMWDGLEIVDNPAFMGRRPRPAAPTREQQFFDKAIYAAEQAQRQGYGVNPDTMQMINPDLPATLLGDILQSEKFIAALDARGLRLDNKTGLTPTQLACIAIYLDTSTAANLTQKLRMMGATRAQWDGWMRQPLFAERLSVISEERTAGLTPLALQRLEQAVDSGAPWAIQLLLEVNKRHDRRGDTADPMVAIRVIRDVLDEVLDDATLKLVSERINSRLNGGQVGQTISLSPAAIQ